MQPSELRSRREGLRITQAQLASYLEVTPNTIARWERGELAIARPHILRTMLDLAEDDPEMDTLRQSSRPPGRPKATAGA